MNVEKTEERWIKWGGDDAFTHVLIVGPPRCGKSATVIKRLIYQILLAKRRNKKAGLTIIEPKGDIARMTYEMAKEMGLDDQTVYIDPVYPEESGFINVMKGKKMDVVEATTAVLQSLFGKQEAFYTNVQELSTRNITLLLKELYGDNLDLMDVLRNLRDESLLQTNVERLRKKNGNTDLVQFFETELLDGKLADQYRKLIIGLRAQLENITSNEDLRPIITGQSSIDLDEHMEKGGILAVNTALGMLGKAGDAFGMFLSMHLQLATFRRKGTERTRIPHYLIIDEYSRYINPDVERFLSIAAEYRVAGIFAIQSLGQLEVESGKTSGRAMKKAILTSCQNKIIFGGLSSEDAKEISEELGKDSVVERVKTYDGGPFEQLLPKSYKDMNVEKHRFPYTMLMDGMPRFHCVYKIMQNVTPQVPFVGVGEFIPRDWKERLEEEEKDFLDQKRPPIWRLKERWEYDVQLFRYQEKKEKAKKLLEINPFQDQSIQKQFEHQEKQIPSPNPVMEDLVEQATITNEPEIDLPKQEPKINEKKQINEHLKSSILFTPKQGKRKVEPIEKEKAIETKSEESMQPLSFPSEEEKVVRISKPLEPILDIDTSLIGMKEGDTDKLNEGVSSQDGVSKEKDSKTEPQGENDFWG